MGQNECTMSNVIKYFFRLLGLIIFIFLLYVLIGLIHATLGDYQPEEIIDLKAEGSTDLKVISDSTLSVMIWNIGYGGLGDDSNFFYDHGGFFLSNGKMIRAPQQLVEKNVKGITQLVDANKADFYLFQEVDLDSKRSYHTNQLDVLQKTLPEYVSSYAKNLDVTRIPIPLLEFWRVYGKAKSGLASFSKYQPKASTRYQLPGAFAWPDNVFTLDRCLGVSRFDLANGKELVLVNVHNSAYDKDGTLKKQQMAYLKDFLVNEYEKGNYLIAGGDWNQCPPYFKFDGFMPQEKVEGEYNIDGEFLPEGFQFIYDTTTPTIRSVENIYERGKTFVTLIDFFLISPNLKATKIKGINQQFQFSDHQPVYMEVELQ